MMVWFTVQLEDKPGSRARVAAALGAGRWNGVAIAARDGITLDEPITNFGDGPVRNSGPGAAAALEEDFDPSDEARMLSLRVSPPSGDPFRVVTLYAPNGRVVGSP